MKKFLSVLLAVLMLIGTVSTIPAIAAEDTAAAGWNGTQVTEPEGSGTKEDPFRIASAANLYWVSRQIGTGDGTGTYDPFAGMYLLQTADIDLNGKTMKSVGYYSNVGGGGTAATVYHVFGGTYDGNGYTVRNGTFASMNNGAGKNYNWSTGMFGIIMDATIKNVTLENITVSTTTASTAYLVGSTVGKNNLIENCVVKDTCNMVFSISKDPSDWCEIGSPASVGGIVGYTGGDTVVRNCVNHADLSFGKYVTKVGGIVGTARLKTTVENCVNTGDIVETVDVSDTREDHYAGGIMGGIHSGKIYYNGNTIPVGDVSISGCYNAGTLVVESALAGKKRSVNWGGILGAMVGGNENCKYTIASCYNLAQSVKLSYCDDLNTLAEEEKNRLRVSPILGTEYCGAATVNDKTEVNQKWELVISGCSSVAFNNTWNAVVPVPTVKGYKVTEGFSLFPGTYTFDDSFLYRKRDTDTVVKLENCPTAAESEEAVKQHTSVIDAGNAAAQKEAATARDHSVVIKGYQQAKNEKSTLRIIAGIGCIADYQKVGFTLTLTSGANKTAEVTGYTVYDSVVGYDAAGEEKSYTAQELGTYYLIALTVSGLKNGTYRLDSFAVAKGSGEKVAGSSLTFTYTDGVVTVVAEG